MTLSLPSVPEHEIGPHAVYRVTVKLGVEASVIIRCEPTISFVLPPAPVGTFPH